MSDAAIRVDKISKRYRIGVKEQMHDTFGGAVIDLVTRPVRNLRRLRKLSHFGTDGQEADDVIWALKDVSFEIKTGEVVGMIGANGAGKTTLLKILSNITEPTSGFADVRGRVSSLLEVGTGFHPELTGRENIYLNGTILGMSRKEVERKFDEIVDFSGVERFIDTPVKRYSSGMKVRLAFAVAAHLEPDILLVDEVLSVGDADFQRKSMGKMQDVEKEGRTVLFVSHNMATIRKLCPSTFLIQDGKIAAHGETDQIVDRYEFASRTHSLAQDSVGTLEWTYEPDASKTTQIRRIKILDHTGAVASEIDNRYPFTTEMEFEVKKETSGVNPYWILYGSDDSHVCDSRWHDTESSGMAGDAPGVFASRATFPGNLLNGGLYRLGLAVVDHSGVTAHDRHDVTFRVSNNQSFGETIGGQRKGVLLIPLSWELERRDGSQR